VNLIADIGIKKIDSILPLLSGFENINIKYLDTGSINSQNINEADILLIRSQTIVNESLLSNSRIAWIGSATAGIDHIDTHYLERNNITWFNAAGCNSASVCSYVLSCLYVLSTDENFNKSNTVGIFGYGNIGKKLKTILDNLNIKNYVCDPYLDNDCLVDKATVLNSDIISIHTPLTFNGKFPTHKLIDNKELSQTKAHTIINTARGGVVCESAIIRSGINYIADVWGNEPNPSKEIIKYSFIATPHIAGHSYEGKINGTISVLLSLMQYLGINRSYIKSNLDIINRVVHLKEVKYKALKDFDTQYKVINESDLFKKEYLSSPNKFNLLRTLHKKRHDLT
jgi:erythronate-4-phosphate dehydrogenase